MIMNYLIKPKRKMKMKSVFLCMVAAATVLAGCSKSEFEGPVAPAADEIVLRSSVIDVQSSTRTAYEGTSLSANPLEALVLATQSPFYYYMLYANGTMTFNGNATGTSYNKPMPGGTHTYPDNQSVHLTGLYPATGWTGITGGTTTNATGTLTLALTGKEDVMFAPQVTTSYADVSGGTYATLAFEHQLTLLKLSISGDSKTVGNIKIKSIELSKAQKADLPSQVTATLNGPQNVAFSAPTTAASLPCYAKDTDNPYSFADAAAYPVTATAVEQAYVLAPPVTASVANDTKEYTFRVVYLDGATTKTSDVEVDLKVNNTTLFAGDTKGNAFNITLKFVGGQIVANATVTPWVNGGTFEQEV